MKKLYSDYRKLFNGEIICSEDGNYKDFSILVARTWLRDNDYDKNKVDNIRKLLDRINLIKDELLKLTVLDGIMYDIRRTVSEAIDEYYLYESHIKESQKMYHKLYKYWSENYNCWNTEQLHLVEDLCFSLGIPYPDKVTWVYSENDMINVFAFVKDAEGLTEGTKNGKKINFYSELRLYKFSSNDDFDAIDCANPTIGLIRRAMQNQKVLNKDPNLSNDEKNSIINHNFFGKTDKKLFLDESHLSGSTNNSNFKNLMYSYCDFDALIFATLITEYYYTDLKIDPDNLKAWEDEHGFEPMVKEKVIQMRRRIFEELKDTKYVLSKKEWVEKQKKVITCKSLPS